MRAISFAAFAVAMSVGVAAAQAPRAERCDVVAFGIYDLKTLKKTPSTNVASGTFVETSGELIKSTSVIPARLGVAFGYEVKLIGSPEGAEVTVTDINLVPPPGLRNPTTGTTVFREEASYTRHIGDTWRSDYQLSYDWTLLPGQWTFQMWVDGRKMCEQVFTLEKQ